MFKTFLPKNSKPVSGRKYNLGSDIAVNLYRYDPLSGENPRIDSYFFDMPKSNNIMVLDLLDYIKEEIDPTISYRKSCREGSCGSCGMNINQQNTLACVKKVKDYNKKINIFPLPHTEVKKDLVSDLSSFYSKYKDIKPWLVADSTKTNQEFLQSLSNRSKLNGLYDCIMCGCCSTACPSYWWNEKDFIGPAAILQALRWIVDSRDEASKVRLLQLRDLNAIDFCHGIFSCEKACPKHLNPAEAIARIKRMLDSC